VKNNGSSGGVQLRPSQWDCKHHEQASGENTLFSNPSNNNCCLPENLLRVCWYKVLLCSAVRFLQFSVVWPILWQKPHTIDVWDDTPEEVFASLVKLGLVLLFIHDGELSFPLFPYEEGVLPFPFGPGKGGLPFLPFPLLLSKAKWGLGC
jgi:hypothetical protein